MSKLKKLLGILARLLLAAGAEKWQTKPGLKVQALADMPSAKVAAVVHPEKNEPPVVVQGGAVAIPREAPATVVEVVPPPYSGSKSVEKVGSGAWLVILALLGNALLDSLLTPGTIESLGLPESAPIPVIYAVLAWVRDRVRHA